MAHESNHEHKPIESESNWKQYALLLGVVLLLVLSFVQFTQIAAIQATVGGSTTTTGGVSLASSSGGETQAEMMARMHPDQVQASTPAGSADPRMVGGC